MIHASLFSGIGGPEVAAAMMGWENAFHCEINPFGRAVLGYWFSESKCYEDITKTDFKEWRGRIDVLTGGFPCQPFSYAGKRGGRNDDRYLWPEMLRAIDEIRPTWVVGENVAGLATMVEGGVFSDLGGEATLFGEGDDIRRYELRQSFTIERICRDLEHVGYSVQPVLIPAAAVGAPHRRDRIFILARNDAHAAGDGYSAPEEGGRVAGCRGGNDALPGERGIKAERVEGLYSLPGDAQNPVNLRRGQRADEVMEHQQGQGNTRPAGGNGKAERPSADTNLQRCHKSDTTAQSGEKKRFHRKAHFDGRITDGLQPGERWRGFPAESPICGRNDGIPFDVDGLSISPAEWRRETLKAYGNAIVPQVMFRIFQAIELVEEK
ncbi:DNA cytosine methyltransferase [Selenomonas ruminantium]|uniref:DNA cytosine methyltransferase n=1 Tax=Selenomonas ruminantium TaxID=971 RepID=UPI0026F06544|nr:DNA (cytosine-5-)-methyltransferase [Selenomonas ruminantium]